MGYSGAQQQVLIDMLTKLSVFYEVPVKADGLYNSVTTETNKKFSSMMDPGIKLLVSFSCQRNGWVA